MKRTRVLSGAGGGFTLLEVLVSLAVLGILLVSVFSITIETYAFIGDTEVDFAAQSEANQAFSRMTEILRKSGRNTAGGATFPRLANLGTELEFRVLRDLDGNGFPYSASTGQREWGPTVYRIRRDVGGNLRVFDGQTPVWHLCRYAVQVNFTTNLQDPTLQLNEIGVTLRTRKVTKRNEPIEFTLTGTIDMRN